MEKTIERYSHINPPPSIVVAVERVAVLDNDLARVNADLESKKGATLMDADFASAPRHNDWRIRATRAREFIIAERDFLLGWIERKKQQVETRSRFNEDASRGAALKKMVADFLQSSPVPEDLFGPGCENDVPKAQQRKKSLGKQIENYDRFITRLKEEAARIGCNGALFSLARAPVVRVVQMMRSEMVCVNDIIRASRRAHDPLPTGDARLSQINSELSRLKQQIGMHSALMVDWLYEIVTAQQGQLVFTESQKTTLALIGEYCALTKKRTAIEYKRPQRSTR